MASKGLVIDDLQIKIGVETSEAASRLSAFATRLSKTAKSAGLFSKEMKSAGTHTRGFLSTIGRLAKLMLIRTALRALIRGAKEGLEMFVNWDKTFNNAAAGAATAMENIKNAAMNLKGQFGAFFGGIITQLEPVITWLINALTTVLDTLQMISRVLQGQNTYYKYVAGSAESAAGSAKKLKNALFGFDELNVLPSDNGSGSSISAATGMYEEIPLEETFFGGLHRFIESERWEAFGTELANKVNSIIGDIKEKDIGKALGKKLGAAITASRAFIERLDASGAGGAVSKWINNVFDGINWNDIGAIFVRKFTIVFDFFTGMIRNLDWRKVGTAIHDMIVGVFSSFSQWLKDVDWGQMGYDLVQRLIEFVKGLKIKSLLESATEVALSLLKAIWDGLRGVVQALLEQMFGKLPNWLTKLLGGQTTTINLQANVLETVTTEFGTRSEGILSKIAQKLGVDLGSEPISVSLGRMVAQGLKDFYVDDPFNMGLSLDEQTKYIKQQTDKLTSIYSTIKGGFKIYETSNNNPHATGGELTWGGGGKVLAPRYASGGNPEIGSLFWAGEAGAEVVANTSHGTGVMNVSQMQEAVANGNIDVVNAIYAMANMITGAVNNKDFDVYMDSAKVGQSVTKYQFNQARRGITQGGY